MKCFVVTKANPRFKVHKWIRYMKWEPTYICDTDEQAEKLMNEYGVTSDEIEISMTHEYPRGKRIQGVSIARHWTAKNVMPEDEWVIWIDDNVQHISCLPYELSAERVDLKDGNNYRQLFEHKAKRSELNSYIADAIDKAEGVGTIMVGFSNSENFFFRKNKWQSFGQCKTQFCLYKNDRSSWYPFPTMMIEDTYKSVDVVCRYGQVLIDRHVKPVKERFEAGGIGSFERRLPYLRDNCKRMLRMYPGLLRYMKNQDYHLDFKLRSVNTVNRWRVDHGYL